MKIALSQPASSTFGINKRLILVNVNFWYQYTTGADKRCIRTRLYLRSQRRWDRLHDRCAPVLNRRLVLITLRLENRFKSTPGLCAEAMGSVTRPLCPEGPRLHPCAPRILHQSRPGTKITTHHTRYANYYTLHTGLFADRSIYFHRTSSQRLDTNTCF